MRRGTTCLALATVLALAAACPAMAGTRQESMVQDDRVLLAGGELRQIAALDEMAAVGVDSIRTVVNWRRLAPSPESRRRPPAFDGSDPASYAPADWDPFDQLVRNASARGIQILMNPSGAIPDWGSGCRRNRFESCRPKPRLFGDFVTALAIRYSGSYPDETDGQPLPRVRRWSLFNEPNLRAWIHPQTQRVRGGRLRHVGPMIYRRIAHAGIDALRANGHARDQILLGETSPISSPPTNSEPLEFWQRLLCLKVDRGRLADPGCRRGRRRPFRVSGVAHHPYTRGAGLPLYGPQRPGSITVRHLGRLERVLARGAREGMIRRRTPIFITEFGVTSNPPDGKFGVPLPRQAETLNLAEYLFYLRRSVRSTHQFEWEDDTGLSTLTFQTGLKFGDATLKAPTFEAYRLPIYVVRAGPGRVKVFGKIRPSRFDPASVEIQAGRPSGDFEVVRTVTTGPRGYFLVNLPREGRFWRLRWRDGLGFDHFSRQATIAKRNGRPGAMPPGGTSIGPVLPGEPGPPPLPSPGPGPLPDPVPDPDPGPDPPPLPVFFSLSVEFELIPNALNQQPGGTVTFSPGDHACSTDCSRSYLEGTSVTLTAQPDSSSTFEGWSGACSGTGTCTVSMSRARNVTATFQRPLLP